METTMQVHDPIHSEFTVPDYLVPLLVTPEVQRLSQVSLLNTPSTCFASLGEVRRYSHTLGVLRLAMLSRLGPFSDEERRAFEACVLVHDAATPPFGHLFEYHLAKSDSNWNHEHVLLDVLEGVYADENSAHQPYAGRQLQFLRIAEKLGIDIGIVRGILKQVHPLSKLLFGTLDFDNLDNVVRMAWGLGIHGWQNVAARIAESLQVTRNGDLVLPRATMKDSVDEWCRLRREAYQVLSFTTSAIATQAVLSKALKVLFRNGKLDKMDYHETNESLVERLRSDEDTKHAIISDYHGDAPHLLFLYQVRQGEEEIRRACRITVADNVERILADELRRRSRSGRLDRRLYGYCIVDNGTFERELRFNDPSTAISWSIGRRSQSLIVYAFASQPVSRAIAGDLMRATLKGMSLPDDGIMQYHLGSLEAPDAQQTFAFAPS